jgi:hypothetical protein
LRDIVDPPKSKENREIEVLERKIIKRVLSLYAEALYRTEKGCLVFRHSGPEIRVNLASWTGRLQR